MEIIIDPEFKALIPPLTPSERKGLEESCISEGIRDALVVWGNILIDGHNRHEIAKANGLEYEVIEKEFDSRAKARIWIRRNQLARRNIPDGVRYELGKGLEDDLKEIGKNNQGTRTDLLSITDKKLKPHNTREIIAKETGLSQTKIARADVVWKEAEPETIEEIKAGEKTIHQVYQQLKSNGAHVSNNSGESEWYTPAKYINAAEAVMGSIDLDPASNTLANSGIKAKQIFTIENSGLENQWFGNVWINPPYSHPLINNFSEKVVAERANYNQCIVLVNNATETKWFQRIVNIAGAVCFPSGRIKFWHPGKKDATPLQGQAIIYIGENVKRFAEIFDGLGVVLKK